MISKPSKSQQNSTERHCKPTVRGDRSGRASNSRESWKKDNPPRFSYFSHDDVRQDWTQSRTGKRATANTATTTTTTTTTTIATKNTAIVGNTPSEMAWGKLLTKKAETTAAPSPPSLPSLKAAETMINKSVARETTVSKEESLIAAQSRNRDLSSADSQLQLSVESLSLSDDPTKQRSPPPPSLLSPSTSTASSQLFFSNFFPSTPLFSASSLPLRTLPNPPNVPSDEGIGDTAPPIKSAISSIHGGCDDVVSRANTNKCASVSASSSGSSDSKDSCEHDNSDADGISKGDANRDDDGGVGTSKSNRVANTKSAVDAAGSAVVTHSTVARDDNATTGGGGIVVNDAVNSHEGFMPATRSFVSSPDSQVFGHAAPPFLQTPQQYTNPQSAPLLPLPAQSLWCYLGAREPRNYQHHQAQRHQHDVWYGYPYTHQQHQQQHHQWQQERPQFHNNHNQHQHQQYHGYHQNLIHQHAQGYPIFLHGNSHPSPFTVSFDSSQPNDINNNDHFQFNPPINYARYSALHATPALQTPTLTPTLVPTLPQVQIQTPAPISLLTSQAPLSVQQQQRDQKQKQQQSESSNAKRPDSPRQHQREPEKDGLQEYRHQRQKEEQEEKEATDTRRQKQQPRRLDEKSYKDFDDDDWNYRFEPNLIAETLDESRGYAVKACNVRNTDIRMLSNGKASPLPASSSSLSESLFLSSSSLPLLPLPLSPLPPLLPLSLQSPPFTLPVGSSSSSSLTASLALINFCSSKMGPNFSTAGAPSTPTSFSLPSRRFFRERTKKAVDSPSHSRARRLLRHARSQKDSKKHFLAKEAPFRYLFNSNTLVDPPTDATAAPDATAAADNANNGATVDTLKRADVATTPLFAMPTAPPMSTATTPVTITAGAATMVSTPSIPVTNSIIGSSEQFSQTPPAFSRSNGTSQPFCGTALGLSAFGGIETVTAGSYVPALSTATINPPLQLLTGLGTTVAAWLDTLNFPALSFKWTPPFLCMFFRELSQNTLVLVMLPNAPSTVRLVTRTLPAFADAIQFQNGSCRLEYHPDRCADETWVFSTDSTIGLAMVSRVILPEPKACLGFTGAFVGASPPLAQPPLISLPSPLPALSSQPLSYSSSSSSLPPAPLLPISLLSAPSSTLLPSTLLQAECAIPPIASQQQQLTHAQADRLVWVLHSQAERDRIAWMIRSVCSAMLALLPRVS